MKSWEYYVYPNGVLKNKLGIKDFDILSSYEYEHTHNVEDDFLTCPTKGQLDFAYLKNLHKNLFSEIYDWAGQTREVEIRKDVDEPFFTSVKQIDQKAEKIFYSLKRANYFINDNKEQFLNHCGELLANLNDLHPFREGNGRTMKLFINCLAISNGYIFDYNKINKAVWNEASARAHRIGSSDEIIKVLKSAIEPVNVLSKINQFRQAFNLPLLNELKIEKEEGEIKMALLKNDFSSNSEKVSKDQFFKDNLLQMFMENIDQPVGKWHQTWLNTSIPENAISGRRYQGINGMYLQMYMMKNGFDDPRFCTFTEANEKGWKIKKGEKSEALLRVGFFEYQKQLENGKIVNKVEHLRLKEQIRNDPSCTITREFAGYKYYHLFNAKQIDGIPPLEQLKHYENKVSDYVNNAFEAMKIPLIIDKTAECPFYTHINDEIHTPPIENYFNADELAVSLMHELVHATGHPDRLNRDSLKDYHKDWDIRCKEELVAELGALITRQRAGIKTDTLEDVKNHQQYCNGWKAHLSKPEGFKFLEEVVKDAQAGSDYIHEKSLSREKQKNMENNKVIEQKTYEKPVINKDYKIERGRVVLMNSKQGSMSQEVDNLYEGLSKLYGHDLSSLVYAENGFLKQKYPDGIKDLKSDIIYSEKHWSEFEKWAKETQGIDFEEIHNELINKNWHNELMETLEFSKVHLQKIGADIEKCPGGNRYTLDEKQVEVVFSPNAKKEESCKAQEVEGFENHYVIKVIAQDTKDWEKIDIELCNTLEGKERTLEDEGRGRL